MNRLKPVILGTGPEWPACLPYNFSVTFQNGSENKALQLGLHPGRQAQETLSLLRKG
jgi:hypothetical protein